MMVQLQKEQQPFTLLQPSEQFAVLLSQLAALCDQVQITNKTEEPLISYFRNLDIEDNDFLLLAQQGLTTRKQQQQQYAPPEIRRGVGL